MRNTLLRAARVLATVASLTAPALADQNSNQNVNDNRADSNSKSVAEANAAAAAAAQAQANNRNLVVVSPHTSSAANGGNAVANGGAGIATANGEVTTRVANNTSINQEAQAATPGSIIITPTSQCGEGWGFAAGVVSGSLSTSRSTINFRCVDTYAALALFQAPVGDVETRAVALSTLANLSPAFDEAITSVARTSIRCDAEGQGSTVVRLAAGLCNQGSVMRPGKH